MKLQITATLDKDGNCSVKIKQTGIKETYITMALLMSVTRAARNEMKQILNNAGLVMSDADIEDMTSESLAEVELH